MPLLALAPMQNVTDLAFMRVIEAFGGPDYYVTEYFRVHKDYTLEKHILKSITENQSSKPVYAQLIGQDIPALVRIAKELLHYPVTGIDLNLGCPAPVVCRKDAGGGLLRKHDHLTKILSTLRETIPGKFTVKTRVGYDSEKEFPALLEIFSQANIDLLTIHGRTVKERYQTPVHPDCIHMAVEHMTCPVIANGNVVDVETGLNYLNLTNSAGLMIGRGAIRNPWLFSQLRDSFHNRTPYQPSHQDLLEYIQRLFEELASHTKDYDERKHVNRLKKFMVYISQGLNEEFEFKIRRAVTANEFHAICNEFLQCPKPLPTLPPEKSKLFCGFSELTKATNHA